MGRPAGGVSLSGAEGWAPVPMPGPRWMWECGQSCLGGQERQCVWVQMLLGADVPANPEAFLKDWIVFRSVGNKVNS